MPLFSAKVATLCEAIGDGGFSLASPSPTPNPNQVATLCEAIGDGGFFMLLLLRLTPLTVCASSAFLGCASDQTASRPRLLQPHQVRVRVGVRVRV